MADDLARLGLFVDSTGVVRATDHLGKFGKEGQRAEGIAGKFGKTGKAAFGAVAVAAASAVSAIASIGAAVSVIRQFETSMSQVAAITGATKAELESLRDVAKELGSTTEFSAAQAADGLRFLGMAGFNAAESIAAIPAVLDLATAASIGLAESADIASNVLSGFGLEAGAAAEVADVLAAASSRANTSVSQLGNAMSTVAPISAALGIDLADTAAAIGVLSDAGIQGERAGTALRGVLASLAGPTSQAQEALAQYGITAAQVNPETQSLTQIFGLLAERGLSTADAMTIFGREAASGALVLTEAAERVGEFGEELRGAEGAASDMASIMRDNLGGATNSAISALQGLIIALGEAGLTTILIAALDAATALVRGLTMLVEGIGAVIDFVQRHTSATEAVTEAMQLQAQQAGDTKVATDNVAEASRGAAEAALQEARAQMAVIDAYRESRAERVRSSEDFQRLQNAINLATAELDMLYQTQSRNGGKFAPMTAEAAAAMDDLKTQLVLATRAQNELLESANFTSSEYNKLQGEVDRLESELAQAAVAAGGVPDELIELNPIITSATGNVSALQGVLNGAAAAAQSLAGAMASAASQLGPLGSALSALGGGGILGRVTGGLGGVLGNIINSDAVDAAGNRLAQLGNTMKILFERSKAAAVAQDQFASSVGSAGGSAGSAAKEVDKLADEISRLEDAADPTRKFRREMEQLDTLLENGLSDGAYRQAVEDLNAEFVETSPILSSVNDAFGQMVDYMFSGFRDGMKGILNIFVNTLKQMAAMALKNRITFSLGLAASGGAGAAAAGVPGGGLSSLFGGGGFLGLGGGAGSLFGGTSGLLGMGGGSGFLGLGAGSGLAGALGGGAFGAAASVALPVLGAVALVGALFKKTEVVVANGVRAIIDGASIALDSYEKTKTDNAFGMSSGFSRDFERLDDAVQSAVQTRLDATINALEQFGFGTDLTGFSFSKRTEIKDGETFEGESEEVIREALDAVVTFLADGALAAFQKTGESISETLDRMTNSLTLANESLDFFGGTLLPISLEGAAAAAALADLYGGLENFAASASFLFENFYTESQKQEIALGQLTEALGELGQEVPATHQAYLDLINAQDLMTEEGRDLHAALGQLAPLFTAVAGTADEAAQETAEYNAGLLESVRLRAEEKQAMLAANKARFAAIRVAEKEARRAQEIARNEAALEALEAQVPQMAEALARAIAGGFADAASGIDFSVLPDEIAQSVRDNSSTIVDGMDAIDRALTRFTGTFDFGLRDNDGNTIFEGYIEQLERGFREGEKTLAQTQALVETLQNISFADFADFAANDPQRLFEGLSEGARMSSGELANVSENMLAVVDNIENGTLSFDEYVTDAIENFNSAVLQFATTLSGAAETVRDGINQTVGDVFDALDLVADPAEAAASNLSRLADAIEVLSEANTFVEENIGRGASAGFGNPESPLIRDRIPDLYGPISEVVTAAMQRVSDAIIEPIKDELFALAPDFEQAAGALFRPLAEIISTVNEGELDAYGDAVARISKMFADGELSVDLYNDTFAILNSALDGALEPVEDLADAVGGLSDEAQSLQERFNRLTAELAGPDALREYELGLLPDDAKALQEAVWGLEQQLEDAADAARLADKALQEKLGLERRILEINGDTAAIRELELSALEPGNRALQERVWMLEDEAAAAARAAAVAQERKGLERQILQLQGNTSAIRQIELGELDESNRAHLQYIFALQDLQQAEADLEAARENERQAILALQSAIDGLAGAIESESDTLVRVVEQANSELDTALGELVDIFQQLEDKVSDALSVLSDAIDAESAALEQSVTDAQDVLNGALSVLGDALDAESQRINDVLSDLISQRDALNAQLFPQNDTPEFDFEVRDLLSEGLDLAQQLSEIARDVLGQNVQIAEQQRESALAQLQGMLAAGAIDAENVADIARRASEFNSRQYATLEEMQFDQLVTANTINELSKLQEKLAQEAQAEEESRVAEVRDLAFEQLDLLEAQIVEQQNALTALDDIRSQFDIATNVLLSIDEAIAGVEAAQAALATAEQNATDRQSELDLLRQDFGILIEAVKSVEDAVKLVEETQFDLQEAENQANIREIQLDAIRNGFNLIDAGLLGVSAAITKVEAATLQRDEVIAYAETREAQLESLRQEFGIVNTNLVSGFNNLSTNIQNAISAAANNTAAQVVVVQGAQSNTASAATAVANAQAAAEAAEKAALAAQRTSIQGRISALQAEYDGLVQANLAMATSGSINGAVFESNARRGEQAYYEIQSLQSQLSSIPSYANGTDYHRGGPAILHENEMVNLPRGTGVSTASEVQEMAETNKRLVKQNEQNATELRQIRRFLQSLADIEEARRAEELAGA